MRLKASVGIRFALFVSVAVLVGASGTVPAALSDDDETVLRICEGVVRLFEQRPDVVWPGYSLAERPFLVYVPNRWAILMNHDADVDGFGAPPEEWPDLGTNVLYHAGQLGNLVGQLAFYYEVGDLTTVAIGLPDELPGPVEEAERKYFGYIVHEAFHQYQYEVWSEVPWAREQLYPIEDAENAALAYLEMLILLDALDAIGADDAGGCRESAERFLAVRRRRWKSAAPFVAEYEQGKEISEGTARYVELLSLELMGGLEYASSVSGTSSPLKGSLASTTMLESLSNGFEERMGDGFVPIADLPRNRIYAVGCAQGVLLDYFGFEWRSAVEQEAGTFVYADLLSDGLGVDDGALAVRLDEAMDLYDHAGVLAATGDEIERFLDGYRAALREFEGQPGRRLSVRLDSNGVRRSRVSQGQRWVVEEGGRSLCTGYAVYTLEKDDLFLQVHDVSLLEENDWERRRKTVTFFVSGEIALTLDGEDVDTLGEAAREFGSIEIAGGGFELRFSGPGILSSADGSLHINLVPTDDQQHHVPRRRQ